MSNIVAETGISSKPKQEGNTVEQIDEMVASLGGVIQQIATLKNELGLLRERVIVLEKARPAPKYELGAALDSLLYDCMMRKEDPWHYGTYIKRLCDLGVAMYRSRGGDIPSEELDDAANEYLLKRSKDPQDPVYRSYEGMFAWRPEASKPIAYVTLPRLDEFPRIPFALPTRPPRTKK